MTLHSFSAMILASPDMWAAFVAHEWMRRTGHTHLPPPGPAEARENDIEDVFSEVLEETWFDIVEEGEAMEEEAGGPIVFGPHPPPALFHWEADHDVPPVFPNGFLPAHEEYQVDDLLWDGAFIILPRGPVPEPRDVDDSHGAFWAPPPVIPRAHHFPTRGHRTHDEDELFMQMLEDGTAEHQPLDPLDNLLLDRPPWVPDPLQPPPPPPATIRDVERMVNTEPPLPTPGWETVLTLLRPWFHEAPWRLEPATNIPEHIVGREDLDEWVDNAVDVLIRRNRTILQLINFDIRQAMAAAVEEPRAGVV